jgi:hypothetical protein
MSRTNSTTLDLNRSTSDGAIIQFRKDGTAVGSIGTTAGELTIGSADTALRFTDAADRIDPWSVTSNTAKDNSIDFGTSARRFKDLYLAGGVYLGGTGAANKLDDYEEGTWTPAIAGWTGTAIEGAYTKIGNTVFYSMQTGTLTGSGSGTLEITGLPFSPNTDQASGTVMASFVNFSAETISSNAYSRTSSLIRIYESRDNTGWLALTHAALNSGSSSIIISGTYTTAA